MRSLSNQRVSRDVQLNSIMIMMGCWTGVYTVQCGFFLMAGRVLIWRTDTLHPVPAIQMAVPI